MINYDKWAQDWSLSKDDLELSNKMIICFKRYLAEMENINVSSSTYKRHKAACHALGGYIVNQVYGSQDDGPYDDLSGDEIIAKYIGIAGGPLIHHDNESWQRELDATCKKFHKFMLKNCS